MSHIGDLACRTHQVILAEEVAGTHPKLPSHHLFIKAVVACYVDGVDTCLRTLHHTHLQSDRIIADVTLYRHDIGEKITVVVINVADGILIVTQALVQKFLVIHIARLHIENRFEQLGRIYGIAYPVYVRDMILVALIDRYVDVHIAVVVAHHAVGHDHGVAVALFVILFNNPVKVIVIVGIYKFFLTENFENICFLIGFLHSTLERTVRKHLVAVDVYLVYLDL